MQEPFADYVAARRREVDAALRAYLPVPPSCPPPLAEAMAYAVGSGGKRFRPLLAVTAADAVAMTNSGETTNAAAAARRAAMPVACAVEFVHAQSLAHDDLPAMDNDVLRRGQPALHVRFGEGLAILAGDGLLTEAFAILSEAPVAGTAAALARQLRVIELFSGAVGVAGMAGGQAIDLDDAVPGRCRTVLDLPALCDMHARKTGGLIRAAAEAGAILAGADDTQVAAIGSFAADVGLAFQIVDDVLDVEGCAGTLGKTVGKDAAAGKCTYPALVGVERSRELAAAAMDRAARTLTDAGLVDHHLLSLAEWVLARGAAPVER